VAAAGDTAPGVFARVDGCWQRINQALEVFGIAALVGASGILCYSVFTRHVWKIATNWEDEASVILLVSATFLSGALVQNHRGHISIHAIVNLLPQRLNRVLRVLVDLVGAAFYSFFSWKSWTLAHMALENGWTSSSTWAVPMWIPYSTMAVGVTLLSIQLLLQFTRQLLVTKDE
jgi:TRAP-type C4-dicarboxylate transport system permease small subunit